MLILVDGDRAGLAAGHRHGSDFFREIARRDRSPCTLLRADRERVLIGARHLKFLGDVFAGLGHRIDAVLRLHQGIDEAQPMVVSKISAERENASGALPITNGARVIDSTPPAIAKSISPARIARPAAPTASRPEAHRRLSVWPGTDSGMPASNSAIRATLRLSSPAWLAQPKNNSSTSDQSSVGCLAISALIGAAARSSARTLASEPPKRPIGVRTASHINTSPIESLPECRVFRGYPARLDGEF